MNDKNATFRWPHSLLAVLLICLMLPAAAEHADDDDDDEDDDGDYSQSLSGNDLPSNARPGECFAKVIVPPKFKEHTEKVLVREESERTEIIPARYEWVDEEVLVQAESEQVQIIPATYKWVEEKKMLRAASTRVEIVPARYETITEQVVDTPARTVWKKGRGAIEKIDNSTGEIMCLVEEPATYKTITRQKMVEPEKKVKVEVPAEYTMVRKRVVDTPAQVKKTVVPAVYKTMRVQKLVEDADTHTVEIPAEYQTITRKVKVQDSRLEWQSVLCETNMSPEIGYAVQRALFARGYNPGRIDGVLGTDTLAALERFQKDRGLAQGGVTMQSLQALNIDVEQYIRRQDNRT